MSIVSDAKTPQKLALTDDEIFGSHDGGKLSVELTSPLDTQRDLSIAYTPGVAQVSRAIAADATLADRYTWANRLVAVVSDGTAVLGLGDIGPRASLPVMEGKAALFKTFGGLDSIPIVLDTKDPDEIVETIVRLRPTFGAVNLEDISAPRCFEIERRVIEALDCPVMHDDQHGTAIVVLAALHGRGEGARPRHRDAAGRHLRRRCGRCRVRQHPARRGHRTTSRCWTRKGIISHDRTDLNEREGRVWPSAPTRAALTGGMAEALDGADVFVGVSAGMVPEELDRDDGADDGDRVRAVQPGSGDPPRRRPPSTRRSWRPAAATSRTRSTTCWPSPACSGARSTPAPAGSPRG